MKKVLIIGKRGFIGRNLYKYLKNKFYVKNISFKNLNKFKNNLDNYDFIINTSINKNYVSSKYNEKFDNDLKILKFINNNKTIYCFISTRKIYQTRANLREKSILSPKSYYSKNKLITEKKLKKKLKNNILILRVSNVIGNKGSIKKIHKTFIDIFFINLKKGFILDNGRNYKDFIGIDKLCEIIKKIIQKKLLGVFNVSIGKKIYLNNIIKWLNKFNKQKTIKVLKNNNKIDSFYLNNEKLMSKIKIKNSISELKKFCYKTSKKNFT